MEKWTLVTFCPRDFLNKYLPPLIAYCACPTLSRRKTPHNFSFHFLTVAMHCLPHASSFWCPRINQDCDGSPQSLIRIPLCNLLINLSRLLISADTQRRPQYIDLAPKSWKLGNADHWPCNTRGGRNRRQPPGVQDSPLCQAQASGPVKLPPGAHCLLLMQSGWWSSNIPKLEIF